MGSEAGEGFSGGLEIRTSKAVLQRHLIVEISFFIIQPPFFLLILLLGRYIIV